MVDAHCHLDLQPNPRAVTEDCERRGIYVLSVTTTPRAWQGTAALVQRPDIIKTALGIHPQLRSDVKQEFALFARLIRQTQFVGEIGIDGSVEYCDRLDEQTKLFSAILSACEEHGGRILSIHSRNAADKVLNELESHIQKSVPILHWFSGSLSQLERAKQLGCWFSVGPQMFYTAKGTSLIKRMPRDRILTESDSPFVTVGGKIVMPWSISEHLKQLGSHFAITASEVSELVNANFRRLLLHVS